MIILWIDPWTTTTGFSVVKKIWNKIELIDYGVLKTTPKIDLDMKLIEIWEDIKHLITKYNAELLSIESLYFTNNIKTWISVAQARWVIIYESKKHNLKIMEFTPLQVKKAISGNWKANKIQVQNAIKIIFWLNSIPKPDDAADAIAIAYIWALNTKNK